MFDENCGIGSDAGSEESFYDEQVITMDETVSEVSTQNSYYKKHKKALREQKQLDPGFHTLLSRQKGQKNGQKKGIDVYSTSATPGHRIRDAITGHYNTELVGSADEDLFFSVKYATGELGRDGRTLFFDNPEQYERHLRTTVPPEVKTAWVEKYMIQQSKKD